MHDDPFYPLFFTGSFTCRRLHLSECGSRPVQTSQQCQQEWGQGGLATDDSEGVCVGMCGYVWPAAHSRTDCVNQYPRLWDGEGDVCVCRLSLCPCLSASLCVHFSLSASVSMSVCLHVSVSLSVCQSLCLPASLCICLLLPASACFCMNIPNGSRGCHKIFGFNWLYIVPATGFFSISGKVSLAEHTPLPPSPSPSPKKEYITEIGQMSGFPEQRLRKVQRTGLEFILFLLSIQVDCIPPRPPAPNLMKREGECRGVELA